MNYNYITRLHHMWAIVMLIELRVSVPVFVGYLEFTPKNIINICK